MTELCPVCGERLAGTTGKALKQHQKSRAHKSALKHPNNTTATAPKLQLDRSTTHGATADASLADEELCQVHQIAASCLPQARQLHKQLYLSWCSIRNALVYCAPPPLVSNPKDRLHLQQPFITLQTASLAVVPSALEEALDAYCNPGGTLSTNVTGCLPDTAFWSTMFCIATYAQHFVFIDSKPDNL